MGTGQLVAQSARFAPFSDDQSGDDFSQPARRVGSVSVCGHQSPNPVYSHRLGSRQQAVSTLKQVPDDMFDGSGQPIVPFGESPGGWLSFAGVFASAY